MGGLISAKFLVVLVIALVVLGPEKLPEATRTMGRWVAEFRRVTTGFTEEVRQAFDASDLAEPVQELRSATQTLRTTTSGLRGAALGWAMAPPGGPPAGGRPAGGPSAGGPSAGPAGAWGGAARPGPAMWTTPPEAELGIPPGDPSLN